jgi:competence protein ComEC
LTGAKDNSFAAATWLLADADSRDPRAASAAKAWRCDAGGCEAETGPAGHAAVIVLNRSPADLPVDCRRAKVLVTPLSAPRACAETTLLLDRPTLAASGSVSIDLGSGAIRVANASRRPWTAGRADPEHPVAWPAPAAEAPPVYRPPDPTDAPEDDETDADDVSRAPP